jgi:1-pyrroline-5-carboxylate dehydrogenase
MISTYRPEPLTDFSDPKNRTAMEAALATVKGELGRSYPLIINGERVTTANILVSTNPGCPEEVVGNIAKATRSHIDLALEAADAAFRQFRRLSAEERARYLYRGAAIMRRRKFELAAWEVFEAGKTWAEADGDVAEAIDFL